MTARVIHFARSETEVTNTSTSVWADCVTLDFTAEANTDYYIMVNWQYNHGSSSNAALFRLTVDNSLVGEEYKRDGEATDEEVTAFILHRHQQGGSSGTVSLALECLSETGSTVTFRAGAMVCLKKASTDAYAEDLTNNTTTSNTFTNVVSVAEGVGTGDDILVVAQMNYGHSLATDKYCQARLNDGSTSYYGLNTAFDLTANSNRQNVGFFYTQAAPAGSTTWAMQFAETSTTGTMTSYGARVLVLDISGVTGATGIGLHTADQKTDTSTFGDNTTSTYSSVVSRTSQTLSSSYTYLFVGNGEQIETADNRGDIRHRWRIDSTVRPDTSNTHTGKVDISFSSSRVNHTFLDYEEGDGGSSHSWDIYYACDGSFSEVRQVAHSLIALAIDVDPGTTAYNLALDAGSYSVTGNTLSTPLTRALALNAGSYSLTGNALSTPKAMNLAMDAGSYSLSGNAITASIAMNLALNAGSYALTGNTLATPLTRALALDAGSYSVTGNALDTPKAMNLALDAGSYSLTGNALDLPVSWAFALDAGSYSVTGNALDTPKAMNLALDAGSYSLTGNDITFSVGTNYTLALDAGSYSITGNALGMTKAMTLQLAAGEYALTGLDPTFGLSAAATTTTDVAGPPTVYDRRFKPAWKTRDEMREAVRAAMAKAAEDEAAAVEEVVEIVERWQGKPFEMPEKVYDFESLLIAMQELDKNIAREIRRGWYDAIAVILLSEE